MLDSNAITALEGHCCPGQKCHEHMNRAAPLSNCKLFAIVSFVATFVVLCGPITELAGYWYSGTHYLAFSATGRWSVEQVVALWASARIGYAIALSALLTGAWLLVRPRSDKIAGRRYLVTGAVLGAAIYTTSLLVVAAR